MMSYATENDGHLKPSTSEILLAFLKAYTSLVSDDLSVVPDPHDTLEALMIMAHGKITNFPPEQWREVQGKFIFSLDEALTFAEAVQAKGAEP